jgi:hypothetical protein
MPPAWLILYHPFKEGTMAMGLAHMHISPSLLTAKHAKEAQSSQSQNTIILRFEFFAFFA